MRMHYNNASRLDQILGKQGSKAKDVYASKISLASRVVKVERSVSNISERRAHTQTHISEMHEFVFPP